MNKKILIWIFVLVCLIPIIKSSIYDYETYYFGEDITIMEPVFYKGSLVTNAYCLLNVTYPNSTIALENAEMTDLGKSYANLAGYYNYTIVGGYSIEGIYRTFMYCNGTVGGNDTWGTADKTFRITADPLATQQNITTGGLTSAELNSTLEWYASVDNETRDWLAGLIQAISTENDTIGAVYSYLYDRDEWATQNNITTTNETRDHIITLIKALSALTSEDLNISLLDINTTLEWDNLTIGSIYDYLYIRDEWATQANITDDIPFPPTSVTTNIDLSKSGLQNISAYDEREPQHFTGEIIPENTIKTWTDEYVKTYVTLSQVPDNMTNAYISYWLKKTGNPTGDLEIYIEGNLIATEDSAGIASTLTFNQTWFEPVGNITDEFIEIKFVGQDAWTYANQIEIGAGHVAATTTYSSPDDSTWVNTEWEFSSGIIVEFDQKSFADQLNEEVVEIPSHFIRIPCIGEDVVTHFNAITFKGENIAFDSFSLTNSDWKYIDKDGNPVNITGTETLSWLSADKKNYHVIWNNPQSVLDINETTEFVLESAFIAVVNSKTYNYDVHKHFLFKDCTANETRAEIMSKVEDIETNVTKIWEMTQRTDQNVLSTETITSATYSTTSDIKIDYGIDIPIKQGYSADDLLPLKLKFWFINSSNDCQNQAEETENVESPYCNPLIATYVGNGTVNFTVTMQPSLSEGNYSIIRELSIDPNEVWITYARNKIGEIEILKENNKGFIGVNVEKRDIIEEIISRIKQPKVYVPSIITLLILISIVYNKRKNEKNNMDRDNPPLDYY